LATLFAKQKKISNDLLITQIYVEEIVL